MYYYCAEEGVGFCSLRSNIITVNQLWQLYTNEGFLWFRKVYVKQKYVTNIAKMSGNSPICKPSDIRHPALLYFVSNETAKNPIFLHDFYAPNWAVNFF
jgi:hypothetical protein